MASSFIPAPVFSLSDTESLSKTDLTRCSLLLSAGMDHLHYAIYHSDYKKFIYLKGYYFNPKEEVQNILSILEKCFDADRIIFTDFNEIKITFDNPLFTFVPADYYDKTLKKDYLSMLIPGMENHQLHQDALPGCSMVNIYSVNKHLMGYLKKEFSQARYFHAETVFVQSVLKSAPSSANNVYVRMASERVTVTVVSNGQLQLAQSYYIRHTRDCLYYALNAIRQLKLDPGHVRLLLSGEVESQSPIFQELHHEVPQTAWLERPMGYHFVSSFGQYPPHYFYTLIALAACG